MTETQVSQNSLADVRVSDIASYTSAGDDDRLRSSKQHQRLHHRLRFELGYEERLRVGFDWPDDKRSAEYHVHRLCHPVNLQLDRCKGVLC